MAKLGGVTLCAELILVAAATSAHADDAATALQDATNQAAIAAQNLAAAQANANAATVQATTQQALLTSQLANQKNEIANIQSALAAPNVASLRQTGTLAAPAINATYGRLLSDQLGTWLDSKGADTPMAGISANKCSVVLMSRPSLSALTLAYRSTDTKLRSTWSGLTTATKSLKDMSVLATPTPTVGAKGKPTKPAGGALLADVAGVAALANFGLNVAAAAKTQTMLATAAISPASKIVSAIVARQLSGVSFFDPDMATGVVGGMTADPKSCAALTDETVRALSIEQKADCLDEAIKNAALAVDAKSMALAALGAVATPDPNADVRARTTALGTAATQATADLQTMFAPDKATGAIPFVSAVQGESYAKTLSMANTCVLSVNTLSSDADSLVRDGTFTSYKLFLATTTTVSWQISRPDGQILTSGFKSISTSWTKQALE